jgi:hypothetical protein
MRRTKTACVLLAALMVLAGGGVGSAQTQTKTQLFGWNLEGEVESGIQGLPQNPNGGHTPWSGRWQVRGVSRHPGPGQR